MFRIIRKYHSLNRSPIHHSCIHPISIMQRNCEFNVISRYFFHQCVVLTYKNDRFATKLNALSKLIQNNFIIHRQSAYDISILLLLLVPISSSSPSPSNVVFNTRKKLQDQSSTLLLFQLFHLMYI